MDPIKRWHEQLETGAAQGQDFLNRIADAGVCFGPRALCTMARPLILSPDLVVRYSRLLRGFHEAVRFVREMIVADGLHGDKDSLAVRIGLPPEALELAAIPVPDPSAAVLSRVDSFCPNGHPWIIELNAESPAGMAYGDELSRIFLSDARLPQSQNLSPMWTTPAACAAILESYARVHGRSQKPRIAIVDLREVQTWPEFLLFQQYFISQGLDCVVCDPEELDFDGHVLTFEGEPIDLIYRRILVHDILRYPQRTEAMISAYRAQRVMMVNSLRTTLLHCKGLFALLHDPMVFDLLPKLAQEMVHAHIPWTGILASHPGLGAPPDIKEKARKNRESWVIKPLRGHGGSGVTVGAQVSQSQWETVINQATAHVVQHCVEQSNELFPDAQDSMRLRPMNIGLDPYLIRGRLAGFLCRLSTGPLGNIHQGGSQVPVLVQGSLPLNHLPDLEP